MATKYKKLHLTFEEIWLKLDLRDYVIVHMKDTMEPKILHCETHTLFNIPDGYLDYDERNYFRKY